MNLSFDFEYLDPATGLPVPWAKPTPELIAEISACPWKVVDIETTGLTPASEEQNFKAKEIQRGVDPTLRCRVVSVRFRDAFGNPKLAAFDMDQFSVSEKATIARASLSEVMIGHNVGFDLYWLRGLSTEGGTRRPATPKLALDTMLLSRALRPDVPVVLARMASDEALSEHIKEAAANVFIQGRSGWSLADITLALTHKVLEKDLQGPKNWAQPVLTEKSYGYATGDVENTEAVFRKVLGIGEGDDPLEAYYRLRDASPDDRKNPETARIAEVLNLIEPQVLDVVRMRERGMPWSSAQARKYYEAQKVKVAEAVDKLIGLEPSLEPWRASLSSMEAGAKADMRTAVGKAFSARGLDLDATEKTGLPKVGEKDLRKARAAATEGSKELFDAWVAVQRAKKAAGMAKEMSGFADRSGDGRLHPLTGHGPVTGRLASSEPNCQQMPRDQLFRDCVAGDGDTYIVSSDYSALDMRVGAALAIRAQERIREVNEGTRSTAPDVERCIRLVYSGEIGLKDAEKGEQAAIGAFSQWKAAFKQLGGGEGASRATTQKYWERYRTLQRTALLWRFTRCLAYVKAKADERGEPTWGSLRDAFSIPGMDIHTWTALGMIGRDPTSMFKGLSGEDVVTELKKAKKELGDKRQTGKVGNLSLLYAMQTLGLVEAAAKNYNIHWAFDEADTVRKDWFATYVEIDLWHAWTELNPAGYVYVPSAERPGKLSKATVFESETLGSRKIYAFSLNAALSYDDQSTGADIMGTVMHELETKYPGVFETVVNQIHDEVLFEIPKHLMNDYGPIIGKVMTEAAEKFTMKYGVHCEAEPAIGDVWLKEAPPFLSPKTIDEALASAKAEWESRTAREHGYDSAAEIPEDVREEILPAPEAVMAGDVSNLTPLFMEPAMETAMATSTAPRRSMFRC
jgi:hypothetical protein